MATLAPGLPGVLPRLSRQRQKGFAYYFCIGFCKLYGWTCHCRYMHLNPHWAYVWLFGFQSVQGKVLWTCSEALYYSKLQSWNLSHQKNFINLSLGKSSELSPRDNVLRIKSSAELNWISAGEEGIRSLPSQLGRKPSPNSPSTSDKLSLPSRHSSTVGANQQGALDYRASPDY